jgi:hypothetical protein
MRKRTMISAALAVTVGLAGLAGCATREGSDSFGPPEGAGSDGEQAAAALTTPLDDRAVLEVRQGLAVPVRRA